MSMNSDTQLDFAVFQLSPRRSRCELFISSDGKMEKIASGFFKPFASHLRVSEEQALQSIKLEVEKQRNAVHWFNKGTLERFVRFVSTPELLELANTFDAEMSQLEVARKIYSQGSGDQLTQTLGENEATTTATSDTTKKELLRAIDVRLAAVKQDLTMALARVSAAGFTLDNICELSSFAEHFSAHRLNEACKKLISLCQRRPELICNQHWPPSWKDWDDGNVRSSSGSDMSIDEPEAGVDIQIKQSHKPKNTRIPLEPTQQAAADPTPMFQGPQFVQQCLKQGEADKTVKVPPSNSAEPDRLAGGGPSKRLSVLDRINLFESKQKELSSTPNSSSSGPSSRNRVAVGKVELRRLSSDVSAEKSVLRRWSGASDMSIDLNNNNSSERKGTGSATGTSSSSINSQSQCDSEFQVKASGELKDTATTESSSGSQENEVGTSSSSSRMLQFVSLPRDRDQVVFKEQASDNAWMKQGGGKEQGDTKPQFGTSLGKADHDGLNDQIDASFQPKSLVNPVESVDLKHQATTILLEQGGKTEQEASQIPSKAISSATGHVGNEVPEGFSSLPKYFGTDPSGFRRREQSASVTLLKVSPRTKEVSRKSKEQPDSQIQMRTSLSSAERITLKIDPVNSQSHWKTFPSKLEQTTKKEASTSGAQLGAFPVEGDSGLQGIMLCRQTSFPDPSRTHGSRIARKSSRGNDNLVSSRTETNQSLDDFDPPSTISVEQIQAMRPSKGNYELNDELQVKADELEKLFAAHKLRTHGDQLGSSRRGKPADVPTVAEKQKMDPLADQLIDKNKVIENTSNGGEMEFDANLLLNMVDNLASINSMNQKFGGLSPSVDYRGKFYEKYMKKRDAKLREEWGLKKAQKEAKMKAMHDSLELSQAEMRAKFAVGSRQDLTLAHLRAEKLRSFCNRSNVKNKDQFNPCIAPLNCLCPTSDRGGTIYVRAPDKYFERRIMNPSTGDKSYSVAEFPIRCSTSIL
ncbi:uncharacterized protein LOC120260327 isoform X3 [Dioscorea cayenensis subsp. rotundata]|uniref:Uncharacterized protein LOC120260327 isoform X3 n=1 Tax=Dioscorea cayennensis subsp. rotundata TaxID=55577 RepID=A0AB40B9H0_DIOCR|nr:uncharacterized protein LOC120260327 isoform X3 [Dioscorea cayenensis subsp. rotundata]